MKSRKTKKISIREHLPLSVRVHYDMVRNFSPMKLFGVGVMALIAVFGVLLVTQTVKPSTSADTSSADEVTAITANPHVTLLKVNESSTDVIFSLVMSESSASLRGTAPVKYYKNYQESASTCPTSDVNWSAATETGDGSELSAGRYTAPITGFRGAEIKTLCVSVSTVISSAPLHDLNRTRKGYYAIAVNRDEPNVRLSIALKASSPEQLAGSNTWRYTFVANQAAYWDHSIIDRGADCSGNFDVGSKVSRANHMVNVSRGDDGKDICIRVKRKNAGNYEVTHESEPINLPSGHSPYPVVAIDYRDKRSTGGDVTYTARNSNGFVTVVHWHYVFVDLGLNEDCGPLHFLQANTTQFKDEVETGKIWTPTAAELVSPPDRQICFAAGTDANDWGYGFMVINVPTAAPDQAPESGSEPGQSTSRTGAEETSTTGDDDEAEETPADISADEPEQTAELSDTGVFDDGNSAGQLLGYVLIAAAVLGTARILVIKKYKQIR